MRLSMSAELDHIYGKIDPSEALEYIDAIENFIQSKIRHVLIHTILDLEPTAKQVGDIGVSINGCIVTVAIGYADISSISSMGILVCDLAQRRRTHKFNIKFNGLGRYKAGILIISDILSKHSSAIQTVVKALYDEATTWVREFAYQKARELKNRVTDEMYRLLRILFSANEALVDRIWLAIIRDKFGGYLFDEQAAKSTVELIRTKTEEMPYSVPRIFLGALTSLIPLDDMFSKYALADGTSLRCDIGQAKYLSDKTMYAIAEELYMESKSENASRILTIYPIVRDEQPFLLAAFPTEYENEIVPVLRDSSDVFRDATKKLRKSLKALDKRLISNPDISTTSVSPYGPLGELLGGVIKGIIG